jgi:hypothetical protein
MYDHGVKRLQIMIEEELDEALERQARQESTSKAALIRRYVRAQLEPAGPIEKDPLWELVGLVKDGSSDESRSVDDVVYPRG